MPSAYELATLVAAVGSGLIAGLCFTFWSFLMRSFDDLGTPAAIRAMQALNARILRSTTMPIWIGTLFVGVAAVLLAEDRLVVAVATVLYGVGALAVTRGGNIPLNEALDRIDPDAPGADQEWRRYRAQWGRWNALRTVACALACAGFALAA